jgi:pre-mRNA-splicing factor SYF1
VKLMQKATVMPPRKVAYHDETETVQMRLYKSLKLWSMYADLEESFGTFKVMEFLFVYVCVCVWWYKNSNHLS